MSERMAPTAVRYRSSEAALDAVRLEIPLPAAGKDWPKAYISPRSAGAMTFSPHAGNPVRDTWLSACGFEPTRALAVNLVHSRRVVVARKQEELIGMEADGIVTNERSACVVITVADCMPIFLFDPDSGAFGALHSGWKGTGILIAALRLMERTWGTRPGRLSVSFGPCIGPCCYPVDEDRARSFAAEFGPGAVVRLEGEPRLDLLAANLALAESAGIRKVMAADDCTSCDVRFGSFRREGAGGFTRMAAVIGHPSWRKS